MTDISPHLSGAHPVPLLGSPGLSQEELDSYGAFLPLEAARRGMPPERLEDFEIVEGRWLLDAGQSQRGTHRSGCMLKCPFLWAAKYHQDPAFADHPLIRVVRAAKSPPLIRGSLLHIGLAHYYRRVMAIQRNEDPNHFHTPHDAIAFLARREDAKRSDLTHSDEDPYWQLFVEEAKAAVSAYAEHFERHERGQILAVEQQFRLYVPSEGWTLDPRISHYLTTLRMDLCLWRPEGVVVHDDHKTRGRRDPRQMRGYARSHQFQLLRLLGTMRWGRLFGGVRTNYVTFTHKPDEREKGAAGEYKFKYERHEPELLDFRVQTFGDAIRWAEYQEQLLKHLDPWRYPRIGNENGGCEHRYGPCEAAYACDYGPGGIPVGGVALPATHNGYKD